MEYISAAKAAENWGVTSRQVQRLLAGNRIPGAKKHGRDWFIPSDALKPRNIRREKNQPHIKSLLSDIAYVNAYAFAPFPRDNPEAAFNAAPERLRLLTEMGFAYLRGNFEFVKRKYLETEGDDALKLSAAAIAASASIGIGDYPFFLEIETWLKTFIKTNISESATAIAEWTLGISYLGAIAHNMVPDWLKNGDFDKSPPPGIPELAYARVKYFHCTGQYEAMLAAAQIALAFCGSNKEMSFITIYLSTARVIACCALNQMTEAEIYLLDVMRNCLPHGFITPFVELAADFGGLLERCLQREFPEYYDAIIKGWKNSFKNWLTFHNHFTKDNITLILSLRDYQIAQWAARGVPYKEIAEQFHISLGRIKTIMHEIYGKLFVKNKKELSKYII